MSTAVCSGSDSETRSAAVASRSAPAVSRHFWTIGGVLPAAGGRGQRMGGAVERVEGRASPNHVVAHGYLRMDARRTSSSVTA